MHTRTKEEEEEEEGADIRHSLANKSIARQSQRLDLQSASFSQGGASLLKRSESTRRRRRRRRRRKKKGGRRHCHSNSTTLRERDWRSLLLPSSSFLSRLQQRHAKVNKTTRTAYIFLLLKDARLILHYVVRVPFFAHAEREDDIQH